MRSAAVPEDWSELTMTAHTSDGSSLPLIPDGAATPVDLSNWSDYCRLSEVAALSEGAGALSSLRSGLSAVLPSEAFAMFTPR